MTKAKYIAKVAVFNGWRLIQKYIDSRLGSYGYLALADITKPSVMRYII